MWVQYQAFREQARLARRAAVAHQNMHPLALLLQSRTEAEDSDDPTQAMPCSAVPLKPSLTCMPPQGCVCML